MTPALAQILCELEAIACERAGMVAENMQREQLGQSMAFDEAAFSELSARAMHLAMRTREL